MAGHVSIAVLVDAGYHGTQAEGQRHSYTVDTKLPAQYQAAHAIQHQQFVTLPTQFGFPV